MVEVIFGPFMCVCWEWDVCLLIPVFLADVNPDIAPGAKAKRTAGRLWFEGQKSQDGIWLYSYVRGLMTFFSIEMNDGPWSFASSLCCSPPLASGQQLTLQLQLSASPQVGRCHFQIGGAHSQSRQPPHYRCHKAPTIISVKVMHYRHHLIILTTEIGTWMAEKRHGS